MIRRCGATGKRIYAGGPNRYYEEVDCLHKGKLLEKVVDATNLSEKLVRSVVEATMESIAAALESREPMRLAGFGTFRLTKRGARNYKHPKSGNLMRVEAKTVPVFRPSRHLKARLAAK